jgi:peptidylprolyl isomerase
MPSRLKTVCGLLMIAISFAAVFLLQAETYRDGTYPGVSSLSPFGQVKLSVVIKDGQIVDIQYREVPDWDPQKVKTEMKEKIIEKQSPRVDAVTTATISCNLVSEAVEDALKKAARSAPPATDFPTENRVTLETNRGSIELLLYPERAPRAVENFLGLIDRGYYDGIIFHRVIPGFMIQGGDPTGTGRGGSSIWEKPFEDEFHPDLRFDRPGLLAMANSGPGTNGSQFFITVAATPWLNNRHTIFGEVVDGYDVVEAIVNSPTEAGDRPREEQKILQAAVKR